MKHNNTIKLLLTIALIVNSTLSNSQISTIYRVWEYRPAPGQFINDLPFYEDGDTENDLRLKVEEELTDMSGQGMISLGAWGGYVVFSFDHPVINVPGECDMKIMGNAFYATSNPNDTTALGGSSEPGIVMVSYDANSNGKPDDEWYELAGSEYYKPETIHDYELTYYRPKADHTPTPNNEYRYLNDTTYILWRDNKGQYGYVSRNTFHNQDYWPLWLEDSTLTFFGSRLRDNFKEESGTGHYYVQYCFDWGYVDNQPNTAGYTMTDSVITGIDVQHPSEFKIDWAVDKDGTPVHLPMVHFIKVYNAMNQYCGWLGETSTEVTGAIDLHPDAVETHANVSQNNASPSNITILTPLVQDNLILTSTQMGQAQVLDMAGATLFSANITPGTTYLPCNCLPQGIYILKMNNNTLKFIKK